MSLSSTVHDMVSLLMHCYMSEKNKHMTHSGVDRTSCTRTATRLRISVACSITFKESILSGTLLVVVPGATCSVNSGWSYDDHQSITSVEHLEA